MTETHNEHEAFDAGQDDDGARVYRFPPTDRTPAIPGPRRNPDQDDEQNDDQEQDDDQDDEAAAGRVVAGVVVNRQDATPASWKAWRSLRRGWRWLNAAVRFLLAHRATRFGARQAAYLLSGVRVAIRRRREATTTVRHERMMRAAEAAGDHESALEWEKAAADFRAARAARRMQLLTAPVHAARAVAHGIVAAFLMLTVAGVAMAVSAHHAGDVTVPFTTTFAIVRTLVAVINATWRPVTTIAPFAGVAALWELGRTSGDPLPWALAPAETKAETGVIVTADSIVRALRHLGIKELTNALKDGWIPTFHTPPVRDGRGYLAVLSLPEGVTASLVCDKRELLAANLHRGEIECWPADAYKAKSGPPRSLELWVADTGALDGPTPEYPLLHAGVTDVFTGVPLGVTPRGDQLNQPLTDGYNAVFGGRQGQGKSNAVRVTMLGAALDPLAELRVYVFAGNGDFDAFAPRLSVYERGVDAAAITRAVDSLRDLLEEVTRRESRLSELNAKKLTREQAQKHPDLRPLIVAYSECHVMFGHKELGSEAEEFAVEILRRGRKAGITLLFDTQSSRTSAIPGAVVELMGWNVCFSVKNWRSNDGFLGDGSFQAGIRATELRFGIDRGKSLATGVSENLFDVLKWYFIEVNDDTGYDAATDVIARAMAALDPATPARETAKPTAAPETRDLLEDLDAVLGTEPIPSADVPGMLRNLAPHWRAYKKLTGEGLRKILAEQHEIKVPSTGNRWPLDPATVRRALARRPADGAEPGTTSAE